MRYRLSFSCYPQTEAHQYNMVHQLATAPKQGMGSLGTSAKRTLALE
jgi:hypothetical protein